MVAAWARAQVATQEVGWALAQVGPALVAVAAPEVEGVEAGVPVGAASEASAATRRS